LETLKTERKIKWSALPEGEDVVVAFAKYPEENKGSSGA
jgi:hypothetical protein